MKIFEYLQKQIAWSRATFGPDQRQAGVIDHIRKELVEIETGHGDPIEWIDVATLALDGAWRSVAAQNPKLKTRAIAGIVFNTWIEKQERNEFRDWPDWRTLPTDKAIEHDRSKGE